MEINNLSFGLIDTAKKAVADKVIDSKEYAEIGSSAMVDGEVNENEKLFIANLDNTDMVNQLLKVDTKSANFDANKFSFNIESKDSTLRINSKIGDTQNVKGHLIAINTIDKEQSLEKHMAVGREVMQDVVAKVISGNTDNYAMDALVFLPMVGMRGRDMLTSPDDKLDSPPANLKNAARDYKEIHHTSRIALEHGVGNCGEKSAVTAIKLTNKGYGPVEIFIKPDHAFTVLGRNDSSNPKDPKTWGPNAVVVDSWYGDVYPASEIEKHMDNNGTVPELSLVYNVGKEIKK